MSKIIAMSVAKVVNPAANKIAITKPTRNYLYLGKKKKKP